ncbi:hypothetical protein JZ785_18320 [Alicyclobacillus curvatus]|nr:hypothetical protein JZ785_18320 [Alicyclobacillus curvatus]
MLRDHLYAFAGGQIDRFLIAREEIPLVAAWFCVRGIADYSLRVVEVDSEGFYEVYRDKWRVQFGVKVPELLP